MPPDKIVVDNAEDAEELLPGWAGGTKPICRARFEALEQIVAVETRVETLENLSRNTRKTVLVFTMIMIVSFGMVNVGVAWYFFNETAQDFAKTCHARGGLVYGAEDSRIPFCVVPQQAPEVLP